MKRLGGQSTARPTPKAIAITRPVGKGRDTEEFVRSLGWTPFIFHTVELKPMNDQIKHEIETSLTKGPVDWIVFMSPTGVDLLFGMLTSRHGLLDASHRTNILAVGPKTRDRLALHGASGVFLPDRYSSAGVGEFLSRLHPENLRIVLVRSSSADDSLRRSLSSKGASVTTITPYESNLPHDRESVFDFLDRLSEGEFSAVFFTSAISVSNLFKITKAKLEEMQMIGLLRGVVVGAIGPATAEELRKRGIDPILPDDYLIENGLRRLIEQTASASIEIQPPPPKV